MDPLELLPSRIFIFQDSKAPDAVLIKVELEDALLQPGDVGPHVVVLLERVQRREGGHLKKEIVNLIINCCKNFDRIPLAHSVRKNSLSTTEVGLAYALYW